MTTLPILHATDHGPVARPRARPPMLRHLFGYGALKLARQVALSATASLIVMGVQYRLGHPAPEPAAITIAPSATAAVTPTVDRRTIADPNDRAALRDVIVEGQGSTARAIQGLAEPVPSQAIRPHAVAAAIPVPPQRPCPPLEVYASTETRHRAHPSQDAATVEAHGQDARVGVAVPLPPVQPRARDALAATVSRQDMFPAARGRGGAPQNPAVVLLAARRDPTAAPRHSETDTASMALKPLRYGLRLAANAGDFALATNERLMSGTADAITALVR